MTATGGSASAPRTSGGGRRPLRPFHYVDLHRTIAVVLLVAVAVLAGVSVNGPWWTISRVSTSYLSGEQVQSVVVTFNAGGSTSCTIYPLEWHPNPCTNVSSTISGTVGAFDTALDVGLLAIAGMALGSAVLIAVGTWGFSFGRAQLRIAIAMALAVAVVSLGLVGAAVAIGPGAQAAGYCAFLSGNQTSCPSFAGGVIAGIIPGACDDCASNLHWGGGLSFYLVLGGGAASLLGFVLLWRGRHGPFTRAEQAEWSAKNQPYSLSDLPPPTAAAGPTEAASRMAPLPAPGSRNAIPFSSSRTTRWTCARCQTVNSPWAARCGACGDHRPSER